LNQRILRHNFAGLRAQKLGSSVSAVDLFLGCVGHKSISDLYFKPCTNLVKAFPVLGEWCTRQDLINPKKDVSTVHLQDNTSIDLITTESYAISLGHGKNVFDSIIKATLVDSNGKIIGHCYIVIDTKYSQYDSESLLDYNTDVAPLIENHKRLAEKLNIKAPDVLILLIVTNQRVSNTVLERIKNEPGILLSYGEHDSLEWSVSPLIAPLLSFARFK